MPMNNPPNPGEMLHDMLRDLKIKIAEMARSLRFSREMLSRVVNRRFPISTDLAVRLERGLSTARFWLGLQLNYGLSQAEHRQQPAVDRLVAA